MGAIFSNYFLPDEPKPLSPREDSGRLVTGWKLALSTA